MGGLGVADGAAGEAGAGIGAGIGAAIGIGIGAEDGVDGGGGVGGASGGETVEGVIEGKAAGAGGDGAFGISSGFAGTGAGEGEILSLSLDWLTIGEFVGCGERYAGIAGTVEGALFGALTVGEASDGPAPGLGDGGAIGEGGTGAVLICASGGGIGGSVPLTGRIAGDVGGFPICFFFASGASGAMVFGSLDGAAGAAFCLFPFDPPG